MEKINEIQNTKEVDKEEIVINPKIYTQKCNLIGLTSCPHLGIYQANYDFFFPCLITHSKGLTEEVYDSFPKLLKYEVGKINHNILEYMIIDIDDSFLLNHNIETGNTLSIQRINMVIHPYLFYDLKYLDKDHKTKVYNAIYKVHGNDFVNQNYNENVS